MHRELIDINLSEYILQPINSIKYYESEEGVEMYDLTIADDHTFMINTSKDQVLAHNCDGAHITGLLLNMFNTFWPELFRFGMIYRFITPLIKVTHNKNVLEFFTEAEFNKWKEENPEAKFKSKYFKGLGTSKTPDFKGYLADLDRYLIPLEIKDKEDEESIMLAFDKSRADDRKVWLGLKEDDNA